MGGSRKFRGLPTRNAVAHGPPGGRVCDRLGAVSGKVNSANTNTPSTGNRSSERRCSTKGEKLALVEVLSELTVASSLPRL